MSSTPPSPPGNFSYPPPGSSLHFDYIDSLVTSWFIFDPNPTKCFLTVWNWVIVNTNPWQLVFNQSAPANGTMIIPLNLASDNYLAQLNFNYIASDGSPEKFLSPIFNVDNSPRSKAVTWSSDVLAGPTPSIFPGLQTSIPTSRLMSSASPATTTTLNISTSDFALSATSSPTLNTSPVDFTSSATSSSTSVSKPLRTHSSDLRTGAIVGIVVGVVVCAGLAAAIMFYMRSKPHSAPAEPKKSSSTDFQSPVPADFIGEKDGSPLRANELSADGQLWEMATNHH